MEKMVFEHVGCLAELMVQIGADAKRNFTCNKYNDGYAEVPGKGYRSRRVPKDIASEHGVSVPVGDLYMITKLAHKNEISYLGATAGVSEFPVRAAQVTVAAIKAEMDHRHLEGLANAFRKAAISDMAEIINPVISATWTAQRLDNDPSLEALREEGRTPFIAHNGRGQFFTFDVLDDGTTEVMVGTEAATSANGIVIITAPCCGATEFI